MLHQTYQRLQNFQVKKIAKVSAGHILPEQQNIFPNESFVDSENRIVKKAQRAECRTQAFVRGQFWTKFFEYSEYFLGLPFFHFLCYTIYKPQQSLGLSSYKRESRV